MNCPSCGVLNPEGARFCGECGTSFPAAPAAAAPPPPEPPAPPPPPMPVAPVPPAQPPPPTGPPVNPFPPTQPVPVVEPTQAFPTAPPVAPGYPPTGPPGQPPSYVSPPPPAANGGGGSSKGPIIGLVLLLVGVVLVGSFVVFGGDDDEGGGDDGGSEQILLEPIGLTLADDFAGNLDLDTPGSSLAIALPDIPPVEEDVVSVLAGSKAGGDEPGLYGGSRDVGVCDIDQLVDFLTDEENADKAEAWADVQGIDVDGIEDFIRSLTPVRLRFDTRVTNHGFRDGAATPSQSILERGTAVLVDARGVPRVKCNCGNPLAEPADLGDVDEGDFDDLDGLASNPDDAWDDFDPTLVIVIIEADDDLDDLILIDLDTGELFERPVGSNGDDDQDPSLDDDKVQALCESADPPPNCEGEEPPDDTTTTTAGDEETTTTTVGVDETTVTTVPLGTGDVQVTLRWPSDADLDLVVVDPNGEQASRSSTTSTGGQLDVDSNIGCQNDGSVENVFWPDGSAPAGTYTIIVQGFQVDGCGGGDYDITVTATGQGEQTFSGTVADGGEAQHTFTVG